MLVLFYVLKNVANGALLKLLDGLNLEIIIKRKCEGKVMDSTCEGN